MRENLGDSHICIYVGDVVGDLSSEELCMFFHFRSAPLIAGCLFLVPSQ